MYGYIRPNRGELRVREYAAFRAVYCGLCETLRKRYGPICRFLVNYDLTFLAMILGARPCTEKKRCPVHPFRKRPCVCGDEAMEAAADYSVILAWWKIEDNVRDQRGISSLPYRFLRLALRRKWKKAAAYRPAFAENTEQCLCELQRLEEERSDSLDRTADCFARILSPAAGMLPEGEKRRVGEEILYHAGRWVYLLDAVEDLPQDRENGNYNPLLFRSSDGEMSTTERENVRKTIGLSLHRMAAALELRSNDPWQGILENIIMKGLPETTRDVFEGRRKKKKDRRSAEEWQGETE